MLTYPGYLETLLRTPDMGLFNDNPYGMTNESFTKWINQKRMFQRFNKSYTHIESAVLPERKWSFLAMHFEIHMKSLYFIKQFPDGFFEAINDAGQVACFLPEPDTNRPQKFRISLYDERGPIYHDVFDTREDALSFIAGKYHYKPGALDRLVGTEEWDRGVLTLGWISDGLTPLEGYRRDFDNPDVQKLFKPIFGDES